MLFIFIVMAVPKKRKSFSYRNFKLKRLIYLFSKNNFNKSFSSNINLKKNFRIKKLFNLIKF
jgi:hypothetical protein